MKRTLAFLLASFLFFSCGAPVTQPAQIDMVKVYAASAAQPWLEELFACANEQSVAVHMTASDPDIILRVAKPENGNDGIENKNGGGNGNKGEEMENENDGEMGNGKKGGIENENAGEMENDKEGDAESENEGGTENGNEDKGEIGERPLFYAYQIGEEEIVIAVNHESPIHALTMGEVQALFAGQGNESAQVWVYASGEDVQEAFDQIVMKGRSVTSFAKVAANPQEMSHVLDSESNAVGILPKHWAAGNVREVYSLGMFPVLAITKEGPQGSVRALLACLQRGR